VVDACTLAVLFPPPDEVEARAVAELTPLFAETLLCVDRVEPYLRQGLGMVTPWLGGSRILSAVQAALAVAQHEQVLAIDGAGGLEINPFQLRYMAQHPSPAQVLLFAGEGELPLWVCGSKRSMRSRTSSSKVNSRTTLADNLPVGARTGGISPLALNILIR
jgi:hypothetical protein